MKRLNIITQPTTINDLADLDSDSIGGAWELRVEHLQAKLLRKFRRQLS